MSARLRVRLRKSTISYTARARGTVRALGLHHVNDTAEVPDNEATRGMVRAVRFLVDAEPVADELAGRPASGRRSATRGSGAAAKPVAAADEGAAAKDAAATPAAAGQPEAVSEPRVSAKPRSAAKAGDADASQAAPAPARRARSREEKA
jgi:large subunit ribosomal protein L30